MSKRKTFSGVEISHLGGIEDSEKKSSLTGSCKHVTITDRAGVECNIVVDFGLHQGGPADSELNTEVDPRVVSADYIFVTHAHLDHIGRLPMLVSRGFQGKIIMTEATRKLAYASLMDSAYIMQQNKEAKIEQRKRLGKEFSRIKKYHTLTQRNDTESQDYEYIAEIEKEYTSERIGELLESLKRVDFHIPDLLPAVPEPLYSSEDVNALFGLAEDAFILEEKSKEEKKSIKNKSSKLPDPEHIEAVRENPDFFDETVLAGHQPTTLEPSKREGFIETYDYGQEISLGGMKKHNSLDGVTTSIQEIAAKMHPAGHVLGSYQLEVQIGVRNILKGDQVDTGFSRYGDENYKLWFGGDMGRMDSGNNLGAPSLPNGEYLYREMEGTYAARNHPERYTAIGELYSILLQSGKHILIPTFSIQRTPDMLILLLDYVESVCIPEIQRLKQEIRKLKKKLRDCNSMISSYESDGDNVSLNEFEKNKREIEEEIKVNGEEIDRLNVSIITDSVLYRTTEDVYREEMPDVYDALSEASQKERFGRVIIKNYTPYESKENFARYSAGADNPAQNRRTKIIVSSAGMCEGGPVIGHLQRMVENPATDIIFTGYAPQNSLAGKLKTDSEVIILGELYRVKAQVHDITGFSGHAGADELERWNKSGKVARGGVDAIVHGGDDRYKLAHSLSKGHKKVAVSCPQLGETIKIRFPESKPRQKLQRKK